MKGLRRTGIAFSIWGAVACGNTGTGEEAVGSVTEALAPAGSGARFVGTSLPSSLFPGERRLVSVTMQNIGAASPANDWTTANPVYDLLALSSSFGWTNAALPVRVPVGASATFGVVITAPAVSDAFIAQMNAEGLGVFGDVVTVPVTVSPAVTPQWSCTFLPGASTLPPALTPGESRAVTVTVQNSGSQTWPATGVHLVTEDTPANLWGQTVSDLSVSVPPGGAVAFPLAITAPAVPGTYSFQRDMNQDSIGAFRLTQHCVSTSITVSGSPALDAAAVSQTIPSVMAPSETRTVSVTMKNTGTSTWDTSGGYALSSASTPVNLWGVTQTPLGAVTASGATVTFSFDVTAPSIPGTYSSRWQMQKTIGTDAASFGQIIDVPVTVSASTSPGYGAVVLSQSIPNPMLAGKPYAFTITMQNTGTSAWAGSDVMLISTNTPVDAWGVTQSALSASERVAPGASRAFTLTVTAPSTPGTYSSSWRMRQPSGALFGEQAVKSGLQVTLCGNGVVDSGETCDDGNLVNGDGCSATCTVETLCGNGVLNCGEQCDDGNHVAGDGCSPTCTLERRCKHGSPRPRGCQ